jgi:hypothetical protein
LDQLKKINFKKGGNKKSKKTETSEEDLLKDSQDSPRPNLQMGLTNAEQNNDRISFSEKFLKINSNNPVEFLKNGDMEQRANLKSKDSLECSSLELERTDRRTRQSKTPRFKISKELIDNGNDIIQIVENQIETLGNSKNQFKFKPTSQYSSKQSNGFAPLTEENTVQYTNDGNTSKFSSNKEDHDFINIRGQYKHYFKKDLMKTISEKTQESIPKQLLASLQAERSSGTKTNTHDPMIEFKKTEENLNFESSANDVMKMRSDFSGNLIRNTLSIDRVMKRSMNTTLTNEKPKHKKVKEESVFGELKEESNDSESRGRSHASGYFTNHMDRHLFSKKKVMELGIVSSKEDTIGIGQIERKVNSIIANLIDKSILRNTPFTLKTKPDFPIETFYSKK